MNADRRPALMTRWTRMRSWWARGWRDWPPPRSWPGPDGGCCCSTRSPSRTWAARPSGRSAACSWSPARSSAGWASGTPASWPGRTGWAARSSTAGSTTRRARTTGRTGGRRPTSTSPPGRSGPGCTAWGCGGSRWWAGPSAAATWPTGTATRCPASTSPGAPGRPWWRRSSGRSGRRRVPAWSGCGSGTGWTGSPSPAGRWTACGGRSSSRAGPRAAPAARAPRSASSSCTPPR